MPLLLTCKCLNIKLHITATETEYQNAKALNLTDEYTPTGFFPSGEVEVELDVQGIKQESGFFVHRRQHGSYLLFRCLNCRMDAYGMHINGSPIIANNELLSDPAAIEQLMNSPDYSKVFRLVLPNKDPHFSGSMPDPKSGSYEAVQATLNSIQTQLSDYLTEEESEMEERIRLYEESQRVAFQELQNKLKEEKKKMISLALATAQFESNNAETSSLRKDSSKRATEDRKSPAKKKQLGRVKSLPPTLEQDLEDPMFNFNGVEDDAFEPSSSEDEADGAEAQVPELPRRSSKPKLMYSTSVPISVPAWNNSQRQDLADEFEDLTPSEPEQIAASMQALAQQSLVDDNRYIFGDRPRPRLNTGDFTNR